jgi:hypothetical protein
MVKWQIMSRSRTHRLVLLTALAVAACRPDPNKPLAPSDSYLLFVPAAGAQQSGAGLVVEKADLKTAAVQPIPGLLETGFASEMLRTVYLAGQYLRDATVDGKTFSDAGRANGGLPVCLVVGADRLPYARGLTVKGGFFGGSISKPDQPWIGIPADPSRDKALIQTLTARFANLAANLAATGGLLDAAPAPPPTLIDGYRMAMEVIAREWRHGTGPAGVIQFDEGTPAQRALFADVRENRYVTDDAHLALRAPRDMLSQPGVTATVLYRMAQSRTVGGRVAPEVFYAPYAKNRMPPGINPAAILGPFRNFQAKLLGVWAASVLRGKPPKDIIDLLELYSAQFPAERVEVIRIFVATTYGATVKPGGCSIDPKDGQRTMAELMTLSAEIVAGRRTMRDALRADAK